MKQKLVILTGAGISAESGIATFRDADGLWENHKIEEVATPEAWYRNPELVLKFYNARHENVAKAQPNRAHFILKDLEKHYDVSIITQNVDDLHERAGSTDVLHLHGTLAQMCSDNDRSIVAPWTKPIQLGDIAPDGGHWRPDIVWFGEDVVNMPLAEHIVSMADILVIIGTSLQVYPAAGLHTFTPAHATKYIIDPNADQMRVGKQFNIINEVATKGVAELLKQLQVSIDE